MKIHRIQAVMIRHLYEIRRNADRITDMVYWPILDIIVWGFFTIYLAHGGRGGNRLADFLLGAAILWGMFYAFQRDLAVGFLDELWSRNLINLFSAPLDVTEYLCGLVVVNLIKVAAGAGCASLIAWTCYAFDILPALPQLVPYMLNLMLFGLALGVFTSGLIFRYTTKVQGLAWSFAGLLQPVSCVFYPLSALPRPLRLVASLLPTTQSFEGMRQVLAAGAFSPPRFWCALALNVMYFGAAAMFFRWIFESARRRGLLVKFE